MKRLFKPVLFPRRHSEPRRARDARLDPRGRRARLRCLARLRRRFRQPRSDRCVRRRRRRSRDRAAGDQLAFQQVPEPGQRRGGPADPSPQRLQDRQPLRTRPHQPRGARSALPGLRLHALFRRGPRAEGDAPADGGNARHDRQGHPADQGRRASARLQEAPTLADDRPAHAQGMDLPEGDRRQADRGLLALPPGADGRDAREARARAHPRAMDEELQAGGALRRQTAGSSPSSPSCAPKGDRRMSANPHANGGAVLRDLRLPDFRDYAVKVPSPGAANAESTRVMGKFLRDVMKLNMEARTSGSSARTRTTRTAGRTCSRSPIAPGWPRPTPGTTISPGRPRDGDAERAPVPGLARGLSADRPARLLLVLRGVHPHHRLDVQPARQVAEGVRRTSRGAGRSPRSTICSRSHVWRQDHNGFSHQDPGFIDHVVNKKAEVVRVYLPPDANCLLSVTDHCLRSRNYVNVVVAGKQPAPQWLDHGRGDQALHRRARASGNGPATTKAASPTW